MHDIVFEFHLFILWMGVINPWENVDLFYPCYADVRPPTILWIYFVCNELQLCCDNYLKPRSRQYPSDGNYILKLIPSCSCCRNSSPSKALLTLTTIYVISVALTNLESPSCNTVMQVNILECIVSTTDTCNLHVLLLWDWTLRWRPFGVDEHSIGSPKPSKKGLFQAAVLRHCQGAGLTSVGFL